MKINGNKNRLCIEELQLKGDIIGIKDTILKEFFVQEKDIDKALERMKKLSIDIRYSIVKEDYSYLLEMKNIEERNERYFKLRNSLEFLKKEKKSLANIMEELDL